MTLPVTGNQFQIEAGQYRAIVTELGAGLRELRHDGQPVITGYQADEMPPAGSGQLLAPWPNRVDRGHYAFGGAEYQLALSEPAHSNAIHGLTRFMPWAVQEHAPDRVVLRCLLLGQQGYPFCVRIDSSYQLDAEAGLRVTITAHNLGSAPAPYGTGSHPYLRVPVPAIDECELLLPADRWLPLDERGIPSGPDQPVEGTHYDFRQPRPIADTTLDSAFTGLRRDADGRAWTRLSGNGTRLGLWADHGYNWLQVFTGDTLGEDRRRKALAIEPMTCPPNAFATGHDLVTLAPGGTTASSWGLHAARA